MVGKFRCNYHHIANIENVEKKHKSDGFYLTKISFNKCRAVVLFGKICTYTRASLEAQMVKNPPAIQETWVRFLGWEDPVEKGKAAHSSILAWRIARLQGDTTEWLSLSLSAYTESHTPLKEGKRKTNKQTNNLWGAGRILWGKSCLYMGLR